MAELAAATAFLERHAAFSAARDAAVAAVLARVPHSDFSMVSTTFGYAAILVLPDLRGEGTPLADTSIADNRVLDVGGPGIAGLADVGSAKVEGNLVQAARSAGIVAVEVSHNAVQGIVARDESSILSGIAVTGAEVVRCHANSVEEIDHLEVGIISGILAFDVRRAVISDNVVERVGWRSQQAAALRLLEVRDHVDVSDNQIRRGANTQLPWIGIQIEMTRPRRDRESERILVGQGTALVHGNLVEGSGPGGLVRVTAQGHATVNDNRCICIGKRSPGAAPVVDIDAASGVVNGNYVELSWPEGLAIQAQIQAGLCTMVGNVATGRSLLGGSSLSTPWKSLNVEATP